ncbi:hypothetical protein K438DRAFT_1766855 [Mycena galopus ATCC 62051]|nr:hypothetical protein K438DRAFT_1766855 [Mycena galopus ATCC 62051]
MGGGHDALCSVSVVGVRDARVAEARFSLRSRALQVHAEAEQNLEDLRVSLAGQAGACQTSTRGFAEFGWSAGRRCVHGEVNGPGAVEMRESTYRMEMTHENDTASAHILTRIACQHKGPVTEGLEEREQIQW